MVESRLRQRGAAEQLTVSAHSAQNAGGQNDQCGHGENHEGINKHTDHCHNALILRLGNLCQRVSVRGGAHTGFIGEQAPGHAKAHGFLYGDAQRAAQNRLGIEGANENRFESRQNAAGVHDNGNQRAKNIETGHNGHQFFRDCRNPLDTTEENKGAHTGDDYTDDHLGNAKGGVEGIADGV